MKNLNKPYWAEGRTEHRKTPMLSEWTGPKIKYPIAHKVHKTTPSYEVLYGFFGYLFVAAIITSTFVWINW